MFQNNTWRNEILLRHIAELSVVHNSINWNAINILINFAAKFNTFRRNLSNYFLIQYFHSYLHTLDAYNFQTNPFQAVPPPNGHLQECRNIITNYNNVAVRQSLEAALNFNCSAFLLNQGGQYRRIIPGMAGAPAYLIQNPLWVISEQVAEEKNRQYARYYHNFNINVLVDLAGRPPLLPAAINPILQPDWSYYNWVHITNHGHIRAVQNVDAAFIQGLPLGPTCCLPLPA